MFYSATIISSPINLLIIFPINQLVVWSTICPIEVALLNFLFCPKPKDSQFTVSVKKPEILLYVKLKSVNLDICFDAKVLIAYQNNLH